MNQERLHIEEIRKRAKDNKARNGRYYLDFGFNSLEHLRNLLIALSTIGFGFLRVSSVNIVSQKQIATKLFISVIFGILSYFTSYLTALKEANYYSNCEKIFSQSFPTKKQYDNMIEAENIEKEKKNNYWWPISVLFLIIQIIFILSALSSLI